MRILIAEDEQDMALVLQAILEREHHTVDAVFDGKDALDYATTGDYDCLVLDIMMPRLSGLEVVRELRQAGRTVPILLLTAKGETSDRVAGLDVGADDYLPKPFHLSELLARVRALSRRSPTMLPRVLAFGDLELDRSSFELRCGDLSVRLANKEYQIMELLMRQNGAFITTDRILSLVWGYDEYVSANVIWTYISYLRRKIKSVRSACKIEASRGRGYVLLEEKEGA